jgi:hypothetical protein
MSESRRQYFSKQAGLLLGAGALAAPAAQTGGSQAPALPAYARAQDYTCLRQSSYDRTGGNRDSFEIAPGATQEVFSAAGPGIVTHIWFTIAAQSERHLKELVLRIFWDGSSKPSVETPVGDFFGLNLGEYFLYQSAFLNCSSVKALNAYFAMPFHKSARITISNEGAKNVPSFYSNIDYQLVPALPSDALYFHAQYRQATPNVARHFPAGDPELNLNGEDNYVFVETKGHGQLLGVTLGVIQNRDNWFGEGDDMTFVDGAPKPVINGTGTEDYFCGAWDFGGKNGAVPFANLYCGAPSIALAERTNGRYCLYRWHADNPITFRESLKHTIEHGHADDRGDNFYSVAYWYQSQPAADFPPLPDLAHRLPALTTGS